MRKDTFSFKLNGVIQLKQFSDSLHDLFSLINSLYTEIGDKNIPISWIVEELDTGSAEVLVRGESPNQDQVISIVKAYGVIGENLQKQETIPYSQNIKEKVYQLTKNVSGSVKSIEIHTADHFGEFFEGIDQEYKLYEVVIGAITGTIQTLTSRRKYSFTLFDSVYDKAVKCYFSEEQEHLIRDLWDKDVVLIGKIKRDRISGRPIDILEINNIEVIEKGDLQDIKNARGLYGWKPGDKKAEETIREIRDAE